MPANERLETVADYCALAARWGISPDLALRIVRSAQDFEKETGRSAWIISGFRSVNEQNALRRKGRPAAANELSTHLTCPATGADVWLGPLPTPVMKAIWGRVTVMNGLRWGGGGAVNPDTGIPRDWPHVDLGPRGAPPIDWRSRLPRRV